MDNHSKTQVVLVNHADEVVGLMEKLEAHTQGVLHRAFSVMLYRIRASGEREYLLQCRHPAKYHSGGLWTNTCCSHPHPNELIMDAANRRLTEELNLHGIPLEALGTITYKVQAGNLMEHELNHIFTGPCALGSESIKPNPKEISSLRWVEACALERDLTQHPTRYTAWLPLVLRHTQSTLRKSSTTQKRDTIA